MSDALTKRSASIELVRGLAQEVASLEPAQYGPRWELVLGLESALTQLREMMEDRAIDYVRAQGAQVTEKGSKHIDTGTHSLTAIPNRTGIDPKVFENRLRAKRIDPGAWMTTKISYAWDPEKSPKVVEAGVMDEKEYESCRYKTTYRLQVVRVKGDTDERDT